MVKLSTASPTSASVPLSVMAMRGGEVASSAPVNGPTLAAVGGGLEMKPKSSVLLVSLPVPAVGSVL